MRTNTPSRTPYRGCGYAVAILAAVALCLLSPVAWWEHYNWQYCWFPPRGPNVEVVVSACEVPQLFSISPDGRHMLYTTRVNGEQVWLRDLATGEDRPALRTSYFWLNEHSVFSGLVWGGIDNQRGEFDIWDVTDDSLTPLQWVQAIEGTVILEDDTQVFSPEVVAWFRNAEKIYYIPSREWAVALGPDFKTHPENNYVLARPVSGPILKSESALEFLKANQIPFTEVDWGSSGSVGISHDGRYNAEFEGFFTAEGTQIGPIYTIDLVGSPTAYGWAYDDSGIYVQYFEGGSIWIFPPVPQAAQPILKFNLPADYLSPEVRAAEEARQAERQAAQQRQVVIIWGSVAAALAVLSGGWFLWRRRKNKGTQM